MGAHDGGRGFILLLLFVVFFPFPAPFASGSFSVASPLVEVRAVLKEAGVNCAAWARVAIVAAVEHAPARVVSSWWLSVTFGPHPHQ
jgi:hypothetical protein